jgi:uncharacterized protein (DUF488 family)
VTAAQACDLLTIGHSNLPADRFITLLRDSKVSVIIDVRSVPFSRWCPWFSSKALAARLASEGIGYDALGDELGGRPRDPKLYCDSIADYEAMARRLEFSAGSTASSMRRGVIGCASCARSASRSIATAVYWSAALSPSGA